jgi:peptide/nickel transport system ATP-binding protein
MTSKVILETKNLVKVYQSGFFKRKSLTAVNDVSFNLQKGEIISLVGESGSGKTTVARIILKLLPPTDGKILYDGKDISELKRRGELIDYWRHVQGIFQDPYAPFNLFYKVDRVFDIIFNLFTKPFSKDEKRKMIESSLKMVDLNPEEVLGKYPHQLSGGQRQRILIARSLIVNPEILLADEPTSMIDASTRVDVLRVFLSLKERQGLSIIFITHDVGLAYYISDRMLVMQNGRIVEEGEVEEIIANPKQEYTKKLLSSIPTLTKKWEFFEKNETS